MCARCTKIHPGLNPNIPQPVQTNKCPNVTNRTQTGVVHYQRKMPNPTSSPKRPDRRQHSPIQSTNDHVHHRMVSQSVPSGTDLCPCAKRILTQTDGIVETSRQSTTQLDHVLLLDLLDLYSPHLATKRTTGITQGAQGPQGSQGSQGHIDPFEGTLHNFAHFACNKKGPPHRKYTPNTC